MSLGFSRFGVVLALLLLGANSPLVSKVHAQGKTQSHRAIELSETNSAEILTNLNQLTTKEGSRQLEDELRSLKGLSSPSLVQQFTLPYVAPVAMPSKKAREFLERRKNWALTAEDVNLAKSFSDSGSLSMFGDEKADKRSSLQQFSEGLSFSGRTPQGADATLQNSSAAFSKGSSASDENSSEEDSSLPPSLKEKTLKLKAAISQDQGGMFNPARARSSFENFFGLNPASPSLDPNASLKTPVDSFLDQFKKGLDNPAIAGNIDPALGSLMLQNPAQGMAIAPGLTRLPTTATAGDSLALPAGNVNAALDRLNVPNDVNAPVLNQWNPLYVPHRIEIPKITPPTPPNLDFPRRRF